LVWSGEARAAEGPSSDELAEAIAGLRTTIEQHLSHVNGHLARINAQLAGVDAPGAARSPVADPTRTAVFCLGAFRLVVGGRAVTTWRSRPAQTLFQYLVTRRHQPVARDVLVEALWGDPTAVASGTSLKVAVHALRQTLAEAGGEAESLSVATTATGYRLDAAGIWTDVEEFDRVCAVGLQHETDGRVAEAAAMFQVAAELYQGDFLRDVEDDWATYRRESLRDQYLYVVASLARSAIAARDYAEGLRRCQQMLSQDLCHEEAYRLLMICHARLGQRGRVRSWYELCLRTLRSELDCAPEPETERCYRAALAGRL
jgi:DNA-binding SARP family transcriptional activator